MYTPYIRIEYFMFLTGQIQRILLTYLANFFVEDWHEQVRCGNKFSLIYKTLFPKLSMHYYL